MFSLLLHTRVTLSKSASHPLIKRGRGEREREKFPGILCINLERGGWKVRGILRTKLRTTMQCIELENASDVPDLQSPEIDIPSNTYPEIVRP